MLLSAISMCASVTVFKESEGEVFAAEKRKKMQNRIKELNVRFIWFGFFYLSEDEENKQSLHRCNPAFAGKQALRSLQFFSCVYFILNN